MSNLSFWPLFPHIPTRRLLPVLLISQVSMGLLLLFEFIRHTAIGRDAVYWLMFLVWLSGLYFYALAKQNYELLVSQFTALEMAQRESRQAQQRYYSLFEQSHDAVFILDLQGKHLEVNRRAAEMLGYTVAEIRQLTFRDLSGEVSHSESVLQKLLANEKVPLYERIFLRKTGEPFPVEVNIELIRDLAGNPLHLQSIVRDITQRKQVQAALLESETRYRSMFESNQAVKLVIEPETGQIVEANSAAAKFYGYSLDQLKAMRIQQLNDLPEERVRAEMKLAASAERCVFNFQHKLASGELRHVEVYASPVWLNGKLHLYSIIFDVTARHQLAVIQQDFAQDMQALQHLHLELSQIATLDTLYRQMVTLTQAQLGLDRVGLFMLDWETERLRGTYGVDPTGELRDEHYFEEAITPDHWAVEVLNAPDHVKFWHDAPLYDNGLPIGSGWKVAAALWNGRHAIGYLVMDNFVTQQPARLHEMELAALLGNIFGYLIERKRAEEALRQSETRLKMTIEGTRAGTWEWNVATNATIFNERWAEIVGYTLAELAPVSLDTWLRLSHPDDLQLSNQRLAAHFAGETSFYDCEVRMKHKDGHWVWVWDRGMVLEWTADHRPLRMFGTHTDITARKQAQASELALTLEKARFHLLRHFIEKASHEFRTPLSIINSSAYMMTLAEDQARRQVKATVIETQILRITRLVDMLLKISHLEGRLLTDPVRLNLWSLVDGAGEELMSTYGAQPTLHLLKPAQRFMVQGDPDDLREAIKQVLDNAYRFTPPDGMITLSLTAEEGQVALKIQDTGQGMAEDQIPHIFETFWRADEAHTTPGFGLGLPIARKIMEMHGGSLTVESQPGQGSTFTLRLPAC